MPPHSTKIAPHKTLQHVDRNIVSSKKERYSDQPVGELLRGKNRGVRRNHHRCEGYDRAAADRAQARGHAAKRCILDRAIAEGDTTRRGARAATHGGNFGHRWV